MSTKRLLLGLGLLLSLMLAVFGDKTPNAPISEPAVLAIRSPNAVQAPSPVESVSTQMVLEVKNRQQLIAQQDKPISDLFKPHSWAPPPKPIVQAELPPPPQPMAPPVPFVYLGKQREGNDLMVFLRRGNATYIVKPGDVIMSTYRVDAIAPPIMTLNYLPLNQQQTLQIK